MKSRRNDTKANGVAKARVPAIEHNSDDIQIDWLDDRPYDRAPRWPRP